MLYNPLGGIARGRGAIGDLYRKLFESGRRIQVSFGVVAEYVGSDHAVFVGPEAGSYTAIDGTQVPLHIRTSRYFRRDGKWRQCHHHGSIDDPEALAAYQSAVGSR